MPRYRLTIAYDGTAFHGWQRQFTTPERGLPTEIPVLGELDDGRVELRTVQGVVQRAVREVVGQPVTVQGASRTDAGVHAAAQCAAFTVEGEGGRPPDERLARALNSSLPGDVLVVEAARVEETFDPIGECRAKGYRYLIHAGPTRPLWDRARVWWTYESLEIDRMSQAAVHLVGEHDFASFAAAAHGRESTIREIFACTVQDVPGAQADDSRIIAIDVSGNGFLYNMVRIIAGTLMDVGRGRFEPGEIPAMLAARDRAATGPTLGPAGLRLEWIDYGAFTCGTKPSES
ncbi:MAG: tRNA pseudouridine synthase A, partial [Planctomycetota bacterium]